MKEPAYVNLEFDPERDTEIEVMNMIAHLMDRTLRPPLTQNQKARIARWVGDRWSRAQHEEQK